MLRCLNQDNLCRIGLKQVYRLVFSFDNSCYCVVEIRAWILEAACCEFSSKFPPLHLTVWTVCSKSEATPSIYWSLGKSPLFFLWHFGLSDFVSVIIREQKGLRKRDYLEKCPGPLNKFPRNWFLHDMISCERHDALHVSNNWLHTVQTVKCKGVNFEENSQHAASNIQALISTTQ